MRVPLSIDPVADLDIVDLFDRLNSANPTAARRFLGAVHKTFEFLAENPGAGPLYRIDDPEMPAMRKWSVKGHSQYLVFYRASNNGVTILRVIHGSRDIPNLFANDL